MAWVRRNDRADPIAVVEDAEAGPAKVDQHVTSAKRLKPNRQRRNFPSLPRREELCLDPNKVLRPRDGARSLLSVNDVLVVARCVAKRGVPTRVGAIEEPGMLKALAVLQLDRLHKTKKRLFHFI